MSSVVLALLLKPFFNIVVFVFLGGTIRWAVIHYAPAGAVKRALLHKWDWHRRADRWAHDAEARAFARIRYLLLAVLQRRR